MRTPLQVKGHCAYCGKAYKVLAAQYKHIMECPARYESLMSAAFISTNSWQTPTMGEHEGSPSQPEDNDSYLDGK
jgi:hypothetical protein